jgi:hypothetical protein
VFAVPQYALPLVAMALWISASPSSHAIDLRSDGYHVFPPDNIQDAIDYLRGSCWIAEILGTEVRDKFADLKQAVADRSPRKLGNLIKPSEIQFHHEVQNQFLWNRF